MIKARGSLLQYAVALSLAIASPIAVLAQVPWAGDPGASTQMWTSRNVGIVPSGTSYDLQYPFFVGRDGVQLTAEAWITGLYLNSSGRGVWFGHGPSTGDAVGIIAGQGLLSSSIAFWTNNGFTWGERIRIAPNGYVGIGVPNPSKALHVNGDIEVTGNINAKYGQDLAEWVPSSSDLDPGTVVILDDAAPNTVKPAAGAYETRVAGVVAERPGIILGESAPGMEMIATFGRVKVRVDASAAAIRIGDLLVTSPVVGTAMRSEPLMVNGVPLHRPGTILGKALEPLDSGRGEILVLLSLQ